MLSIANNQYAFRLGCKNASRTIFCSCYLFDDNRGCRPAGCLLGVAGVSLDASGHVVRRAGRGLWPTMANLRKNAPIFFCAFLRLYGFARALRAATAKMAGSIRPLRPFNGDPANAEN